MQDRFYFFTSKREIDIFMSKDKTVKYVYQINDKISDRNGKQLINQNLSITFSGLYGQHTSNNRIYICFDLIEKKGYENNKEIN